MKFIKEKGFILLLIVNILLMVQQCNDASDRSVIKLTNEVTRLEEKIDSINIVNDIRSDEIVNEVSEEMEETMLNFLIYEDDVDKGKMSLGELKMRLKDREKSEVK